MSSSRTGWRGRALRAAVAGGAAMAIVTGVAGVSLAAAPSAPIHKVWRVVKNVRGGRFAQVTAIAAAGSDGGWAFNGLSGPAAWERHRSVWTRVAFPVGQGWWVGAAGASSRSDVWAFATDGTRTRVTRWTGSHWAATPNLIPGVALDASVVSARDVWLFTGSGAWHWDGRTWSRPGSGRHLLGGSALSGHDAWAFGGTDVAHWNGRVWRTTSVAKLLPAKLFLNGPALSAIVALSPGNVYAVGSGNRQDEGGPLALLHFNGHHWRRVAFGNFAGDPSAIAADGGGGVWIAKPGPQGSEGLLLHFTGGKLVSSPLPGRPQTMAVSVLAHIPGTTDMLAGGMRHQVNNPGVDDAGVILGYGA